MRPIAQKDSAVALKPFSVLSEPLMQERASRRRIKIYKRSMERAVWRREFRQTRRLISRQTRI